MNAKLIHILLAFLQAQNSLRKPCQTRRQSLWQTSSDKTAGRHDTPPLYPLRRTFPTAPQNFVPRKEALCAAKEAHQAAKEGL